MSILDKPRNPAVARAITSCHEARPPSPRPNYAAWAVLHDGAGVSAGAHQATDRSDALDKVVARYILYHGTLADALKPYIPILARNTHESIAAMANDSHFKTLMLAASVEPAMRRAQDEVFDVEYMQPAGRLCDGSGWTEPLSLAVVYDSKIQGSFERIRDHKIAGKIALPPAPEREWITAYVKLRKAMMQRAGNNLSIFRNPIMRNTVYRMETFEGLIAADNWSCVCPFVAHGVTVNESDLRA